MLGLGSGSCEQGSGFASGSLKLETQTSGWSLTAQKVLRHCADHLEDFMVPKFVEFRDAIPKSANGKIDKLELFAMAAGEKGAA